MADERRNCTLKRSREIEVEVCREPGNRGLCHAPSAAPILSMYHMTDKGQHVSPH